MDVNYPIELDLSGTSFMKNQDFPPWPQRVDTNLTPSEDESMATDQSTTNQSIELEKDYVEWLLEQEIVDLYITKDHEKPWRGLLPRDRSFTVSRTPLGLSGINGRALYDIVVNITGRTVQGHPATLNQLRAEEGNSCGVPPAEEQMSTWDSIQMMLLEGFFVGVIAGLHALAWNHEFPTDTERLLWRASCLGLLLPMPAIMLASMFNYHTNLTKICWHAHMEQYNLVLRWAVSLFVAFYSMADVKVPTDARHRKWKLVGHLLTLTVCVLLLACYLVSILFITIESYISLRNPPKDVFLTPLWSDYWPHF